MPHSRDPKQAPPRPVVYCVVPRDLAERLHEPLRRHFRDDPSVEVVVEQRGRERRAREDRRSSERVPAPGGERRLIRATAGRRVADRRAPVAMTNAPQLPRKARPHAKRLLFVERLEPTGEQLEDADTARLVMRIQAGERDAFGDLYLRYFDRVYNYLKVVFRSSHEAEDLTQQVFVEVLENLDRYERRDKPFRAWLFVLVRNHSIARLKRQRRMDPMDPAELDRRREHETAPLPEPAALGWISDRELLLFIERLPALPRQVLALRYMLGLSSKEAAIVLGCSPEVVRQQQSRALKFLRERLTAIGREPERRNRIGSRLLVPQARVLRARRFTLVTSGSSG